ncbi:MAG: FecR domain-containing protein [Comamonas sp.]
MIGFALSLIGRQHHGAPQDAAAAREEFARWRQTDARHESAALTALDYWRATAAGELQGSVARPERARAGRRRALQVLGLGAGLGTLVVGGRWVWRLPTEDFALRTERGRLLARELADGSKVHLAANTQATVRYFRDRREVTLAQGEIHCEVRRDASRPFTVSTEWGRVEVLGTVFSVRARAAGMRVAVAQGRVAVFAADHGAAVDASVVLVGGQAVAIDRNGLHAPSATRADSVAAWRDGWLVFEDTPLPDAIAQWNDYLARPIRLRDAGALASLRLSGSFPMRTPDAFMRNLPAMLAVTVERRDDAWVVGPRLARRAGE